MDFILSLLAYKIMQTEAAWLKIQHSLYILLQSQDWHRTHVHSVAQCCKTISSSSTINEGIKSYL